MNPKPITLSLGIADRLAHLLERMCANVTIPTYQIVFVEVNKVRGTDNLFDAHFVDGDGSKEYKLEIKATVDTEEDAVKLEIMWGVYAQPFTAENVICILTHLLFNK